MFAQQEYFRDLFNYRLANRIIWCELAKSIVNLCCWYRILRNSHYKTYECQFMKRMIKNKSPKITPWIKKKANILQYQNCRHFALHSLAQSDDRLIFIIIYLHEIVQSREERSRKAHIKWINPLTMGQTKQNNNSYRCVVLLQVQIFAIDFHAL